MDDLLRIYTMEQMFALYEAACRNKAEEMISHAVAVRAAGADGKAWKEYLKEMGRVAKGPSAKRQQEPEARVTREQAATLGKLLSGKQRR